MQPLVIREDHEGLATLTLNRPDKLNALTVAMFQQLRAHVAALAADTDRIGMVLLRGAGKCFSAGHDLADIAHGEHPPEPHFQADTIELLAKLPQPVISAVENTIMIVATAVSAGVMLSRRPENISRGSVRCSGPAISSAITTSSNDAANPNSAPEAMAGMMAGSVMRQKWWPAWRRRPPRRVPGWGRAAPPR